MQSVQVQGFGLSTPKPGAQHSKPQLRERLVNRADEEAENNQTSDQGHLEPLNGIISHVQSTDIVSFIIITMNMIITFYLY